jgi:hypothetical protein
MLNGGCKLSLNPCCWQLVGPYASYRFSEIRGKLPATSCRKPETSNFSINYGKHFGPTLIEIYSLSISAGQLNNILKLMRAGHSGYCINIDEKKAVNDEKIPK